MNCILKNMLLSFYLHILHFKVSLRCSRDDLCVNFRDRSAKITESTYISNFIAAYRGLPNPYMLSTFNFVTCCHPMNASILPQVHHVPLCVCEGLSSSRGLASVLPQVHHVSIFDKYEKYFPKCRRM